MHQKDETVSGNATTTTYDYDDAGRLWSVTQNAVVVGAYGYDANGNRTSASEPGNMEANASNTSYDAQDRMLSFRGVSYGYGANGDLSSKTDTAGRTDYAYDSLGNLLAVGLPDGRSVGYVVDGRNRRVGKKVDGQLVEGFLYDGQLRPVAWLDVAGAMKATFVYGLRVNVPEYMTTTSGTYRIITDHLGSPRLVVNTSTGAVAQRIDYDAWGKVLADTNPGFQPFGFAGGIYDRDTGLVRFGARDYDPSTGRWTNKDPIRFSGGTANLYEYVGNDPVNWVDPRGLLQGNPNDWAPIVGGSGVLGGAGGLGAGTALSWAGGAGLAFGGGWLAGTWLNGYLEPYIQNMLDKVIGPPGGYQAVKPDIKQVNDIAGLYHLDKDQRDDFGDWLEQEKCGGRGGTKNKRGDFTWSELEEKIREFLGLE